MENLNEFRPVAKFWYKNIHYHMFINRFDKVSYLIINEEGEYEYPTLEQLLEINTVIHSYVPDIHNIEKDKLKNKRTKKSRFVPKVILGGAAMVLSGSLLTGCGFRITDENNHHNHTNDTAIESTVDNYEDAYNDLTNDDEVSNEEITSVVTQNDNTFGDLSSDYDQQNIEDNGKTLFTYDPSNYTYLLAGADDPDDFKYATDFRDYSHMTLVSDASAFDQVFDFAKPTYNDLERVINNNSNISDTYKQSIKTYVKEWLTMWPDSDLSVLYVNLQDLTVKECTPDEISVLGISSTAVACYQNSSNTIYVQQGLDPNDRTSNDTIVLWHELTHAATTYKKDYNGHRIRIGTFSSEIPADAGIYYEEAVITNLIYQLRDNDVNTQNRSIYYTVPCSYYRIIMDCVGYDGNDLMNHSSTYLADLMGDYMNDRTDSDEYAYYILQMIGYKYILSNNKYISITVDSFEPLYEYITQMYMKKYLKEGMSSEQAEQVFNNFVAEMTWNIENLNVAYEEEDPEIFRPTFEQCCEDLGITLSRTLH